MKIASIVAVAMLAASLAFAQTPAPTPPAPSPAVSAPATPKSSPAMGKKAVSTECSAQADAQKLHGKARKTFRSKCKATGGKAV